MSIRDTPLPNNIVDISVEHSYHVPLAYMGQNHRFRNLKTGSGNIVKDRLRHDLLPSPRGVTTAPRASEGIREQFLL